MKSLFAHKSSREVPRISSSSFLVSNHYSFQLVSRKGTRPFSPLPGVSSTPEVITESVIAEFESETISPVEVAPVKKHKTRTTSNPPSNQEEGVTTDESKRLFLRLAGVAGLGVVAATMLPKKAEAYVLGSSPTTGVVGMKNSSNVRIDPATETTVAGIKTQTDKLTFAGGTVLQVGGDIGIQNIANATINPATEDTLALMKAQTDKLTFDGSNNLMTSGGGGTASTVGLKDTTSTQVNPATDDAIVYLRRMVKLMESQATVDSANRQRIAIDAGTLPTVTTVGTVSTITGGTITTITNPVPIGNVATLAGQNQQMFQDAARTAYATNLRQNLIFS